MRYHIKKYADLILDFLNQNIDSLEFENKYLKAFKEEKEELSEKEYIALDTLFSAVDAFCADPDLRDEYDIDEEELIQEAKLCLHRLGSVQ